MSGVVRPVSPAPAAADAPATGDAAGKAAQAKRKDAQMVARQFEAIFVRAILRSGGVAGKDGPHADLAVDALASHVTEGRGLGLSALLEKALDGSHGSHARSPTSPAAAPAPAPAIAPEKFDGPPLKKSR